MHDTNPQKPSTLAGVIHHIELYVSDLERSREFWGWFLEKLGYSRYQEWDDGTSWKLGSSYIVFVRTEDRYLDVPYHRCRVGLNHLAFHAASREQVDVFEQELRSRGVTVLYPDRHPYAARPDTYALFFEDPDRIKVELVGP